METTESRLIEILRKKSFEFSQEENFEKLVEANKVFNSLIEKGVAVKRGYNLLSLDDRDLYSFEIATNI